MTIVWDINKLESTSKMSWVLVKLCIISKRLRSDIGHKLIMKHYNL